jgi:hypothetical protein
MQCVQVICGWPSQNHYTPEGRSDNRHVENVLDKYQIQALGSDDVVYSYMGVLQTDLQPY